MITVLSRSEPRARNEYRCNLGRGEPIGRGERHAASCCVDGGCCYTFRAHLHCWALSNHDYAERDRLWDDDGLSEVVDIDLATWTRADVEAACDRQGWPPSHPSRERARRLWQRAVEEERRVLRYLLSPGWPGVALDVYRGKK